MSTKFLISIKEEKILKEFKKLCVRNHVNYSTMIMLLMKFALRYENERGTLIKLLDEYSCST